MKKIYASIFATLLGATMAFAQEEEHTLNFVYQGEVVANGATITVTEVETIEIIPGTIWMNEMDPKLQVINNEDSKVKATMECEGILNYESVEFCWGQCYAWGNNTKLSNTIDVEANETKVAQVHVAENCAPQDFVINSSVKLTLYPALDPEDVVTLTLVFDSSSSSVKEVTKDKQMEVFNLCGKKVGNSTIGLSKGIYIIRQGGTSRKVTIK